MIGSQSEISNAALTDYTQTKENDRFVGFNVFINSPSYKLFRKKYLSLTYNLNTPASLVHKGEELLPKLFENFKYTHYSKKQLYLSALIFFIYQNENANISVRGLQEKLYISNSKSFFKVLQHVQHLYSFPNHSKKDLIETNVFGLIIRLCKIVINPDEMDGISPTSLEEVAQRLAKAIQSKSWFDNNSTLCQIEYISITSTILSAHYHIAMIPKRKRSVGSKRRSFRYATINYQKVEELLSASYRTIAMWTAEIQKNLFEIVQIMPVSPGCVKSNKDVGRVLVEILNFLDLGIDSVFEETKFQADDQHLKMRKEFAVTSLNLFFEEFDIDQDKFPWKKFMKFLESEAKKSKIFKESDFKLNQKLNYISIDGHEIHLEHIKIIFELFSNGATLAEINTEKLSDLVKKYIESKLKLESELIEIEDSSGDEDIDQYIRTPEEIKTFQLAEENSLQ